MHEIGFDFEMGAGISGDSLKEGLKSYAQLVTEGRATAKRTNTERLDIDPQHRDYIYFSVPPYPEEKEFYAQWGWGPRTISNFTIKNTKLVNTTEGSGGLLFLRIDPARSRWIYSGWRTDISHKDTLRRHMTAPIEEVSIQRANGIYPAGVSRYDIEVDALTPVIGPEWFIYQKPKRTKTEFYPRTKGGRRVRHRLTRRRQRKSHRRQ